MFLRSLAFNGLFYLNLIVQLLVYSPVFFFVSEATGWWIVKNWARSNLWLLEHVAGIRSDIRGKQNLAPGPIIIAAKHQSVWDVFAFLPYLDRPTFILKKELLSIPFFGWFARRMRMIPVDRARRGGAVASMIEGAEKAAADGRQIVIFPEGTRTAPGAAPDYRQGVFRLYEALGLPVVPVALNSGLYWPRRQFVRRPGTIRADILAPVPPDLPRAEFLDRLRGGIEERSADLLAEAYARDGYVPAASAAKPDLDDEPSAPR
ncbi:1-acyl-sn-glycerol-3-phosphate acyltransferase [Aurantimonas aggregata]|uniref:1-acyl-sn-glycerol-3-phosphate acyltransferase n=2 Tax=Aurantimonas aggregata TaxID=2047720 RepID=A0A6L9MLK6_9HYPH|nr:lysophospholipid acyltransferase family protein [Aurantimonas aggregata]NDV88727.1 1-acyl-sn-glycerol-3-phosphate acyltransferase [Aurantimonas aggregata]